MNQLMPNFWIMVATSLLFSSGARAQNPPYPQSSIFSGIQWKWDTHIPDGSSPADGSDQWPVTWGDDDVLYAAWGDGGGFGGTDNDYRVSMGVAQIIGTPLEDWLGLNLWGGKDPLSSQSAEEGKARILFIDGTIFLWAEKQDDWTTSRIIKSNDYGMTWTMGEFILESPLHTFNPIQFGKGYSGAPDPTHVYGFFFESGQDSLFLARVPRSAIEERDSYEVFSGLDSGDLPTWSNLIAERQEVFNDPNGVNWGFMAVFHPVFGRYVLTVSHGGTNGEGPGLGIFDARDPWGPWTTIVYVDQWKDSKTKFCFSIPQKWMSPDGLTFWMVHSGWPEYDGYHHIQGTFQVQEDTVPPAAPTGLFIRSNIL